MKCIVCGKDNPPEARFCASCGSNLATAAEQPAPTLIPSAEPAKPMVAVEYMGFWIRFGAAIIDLVVVWLIFFVLSRVLVSIVGDRTALLSSFFWCPVLWLYLWLFTGLKGQTLGKMAVGIKVVNAQGDRPGLGMAALREIPGKLISGIVLYLGFLWIIWDKQKQGWHDKIASTYIVRR